MIRQTVTLCSTLPCNPISPTVGCHESPGVDVSWTALELSGVSWGSHRGGRRFQFRISSGLPIPERIIMATSRIGPLTADSSADAPNDYGRFFAPCIEQFVHAASTNQHEIKTRSETSSDG